MEPFDTFEHEGIKVELHYDWDPGDPREWQRLGEMVCWHRRYNLGDRQPDSQEEEALNRGGFKLLDRYLRIAKGATQVIPLGLIDHSGISMYAGGGSHWSDAAGWDSGTVGFIFDTPQLREECGTPPDLVEKGLREEIEVYDEYLTGQVYGYVAAPDEDDQDSCWGFFGCSRDDSYLREEAKASAAAIAHERAINEEPVDVAEVLASL